VTARERLRRLVHDVGKYVARTARNLEPGAPLDGELVGMLARDLYELGPERRRASEVFDALVVAADRNERSFRALPEIRARLGELDALEAGVRAGEREAVEAARAIALAVEERLRALEREAA
jgi:hypothetical protein